jgi:hypothetical protein
MRQPASAPLSVKTVRPIQLPTCQAAASPPAAKRTAAAAAQSRHRIARDPFSRSHSGRRPAEVNRPTHADITLISRGLGDVTRPAASVA